jgi:hypothetical protein
MASASSGTVLDQPPVRLCPCGLTQEKILKATAIFLGPGGVCKAIRRGSKTEECGEPLGDHPAGKGLIILVDYFALCDIFSLRVTLTSLLL